MRYTLTLALLIAGIHGAFAMGASLTDLPASKSAQSCQKWAAEQDEDAVAMWGLMENGKNSDDVAKLRLALYCLGDRPPDIINVASSVGAAQQFCRTHARTRLCRNLNLH